jgi:hypothetical protein
MSKTTTVFEHIFLYVQALIIAMVTVGHVEIGPYDEVQLSGNVESVLKAAPVGSVDIYIHMSMVGLRRRH